MNNDLRIFAAKRRRAIFRARGAPMVAGWHEKRATGGLTAVTQTKFIHWFKQEDGGARANNVDRR